MRNFIIFLFLIPNLLFGFGGSDITKMIDEIVSPKSEVDAFVKYNKTLGGWTAAHDGVNEFLLGSGGGGEFNYLSNGDAEGANPFTCYSPTWAEVQKFVPAEIVGGDKFGSAMAMSGDYLIIGAYDEDGAGSDRGAAFAYKTYDNGVTWTLKQKLVSWVPENSSKFGFSVAIDGDLIAIGAYYQLEAGNPSGAVFTFKTTDNGETWTNKVIIKSTDIASGDAFGYSVALDNNIIVVGALTENSGNGAAYVFKSTDNRETWTQKAKLASGVANTDFGMAVGVNGWKLVVGVPGNDTSAVNAGAIRAYNSSDDGETWVYKSLREASDLVTTAYFGASIAMDDDNLIVGAWKDTEHGTLAGAVYAYSSSDGGENWDNEQKLVASDIGNYYHFGHAVSIDGDTLVIGASNAGGVTGPGKAYTFTLKREPSRLWYERDILTGTGIINGDLFGWAVAVYDNIVAVGARAHNAGGYAWNFNFTNNISVTKNNINPIFETNDFGFTGSNHLIGDYCKYPFTIDGGDINKRLFTIVEKFRDYTDGTATLRLFSTDENHYVGPPITIDETVGLLTDESLFTLNNASSTNYEFRTVFETTDAFDFNADNFRIQRAPVSKTRFENGGEKNYLIYGDAETTNPWTSSKSFNERQKIVASDLQDNMYFGKSVAIYNNLMVIGANELDVGGNTNQGAAYVYKTDDNGETWSQKQRLTVSDPQAHDNFGKSVAIYNNLIVVGAYAKNNTGTSQGAAYVFKTADDGDTWSQKQKLTASDLQDTDFFGQSVSIHENLIIIGADSEDGAGTNRGAAYVFKTADDGDTWSQKQKLTASDPENYDNFGHSVSIHENLIIIGAKFEDGSGTDRGAAYVFKTVNDGDTWTQKQKLTASDTENSDQFGYSVVINNNLLVIGADSEDGSGTNQGAAYVYKTDDNGETWSQKQKLTASDTENSDQFGYSVSIHLNWLVVGAYAKNNTGTSQGAAYVFKTADDGDTWTQKRKFISSDSEDGDHFGCSVSINNNLFTVGAYWEDGAGTNRGAAYAFRYTENLFVEKNTDSPLYDKADWKVYSNGYQQIDDYLYYPFSIQRGDNTQMLSFIVENIKATSTYDTDDASFKVWDIDNERYVSGNSTIWASTIGIPHDAGFPMDATSLDYELHIVSNVTTAWEFNSDNYRMQRRGVQKGTPSTNWENFTPVFINDAGMGWVVTLAQWRQQGPNIQINLKISATGTGTSGSNLHMELPNSLSYKSDMGGSVTSSFGSGTFYDSSTVIYDPSYFWLSGGTDLGFKTDNLSFIRGGEVQSSDVFSIFAEIPIAGWQAEANMSSTTLNRLIYAEYHSNNGETITGGVTDIPWKTKFKDSTSAWDGSKFPAQEDGVYELNGSVYLALATTGQCYFMVQPLSGPIQYRGLASSAGSFSLFKVSGKVWLNRGEILSIRFVGGSPTLQNDASSPHAHRLSITKINTGTEKLYKDAPVYVEVNTSAQTITHNNSTQFNPTNELHDTHDCFSSGLLKAPRDTVYRFCHHTQYSGATGWHLFDDLYAQIVSSGSPTTKDLYYHAYPVNLSASSIVAPTRGCASVYLREGETAYIALWHYNGLPLTLNGTAAKNWITITSE